MATISTPALKRLQTLYSQHARRSIEVGDPREARLAWASDILGHAVSSFSSLQPDEGKKLTDALQGSMAIPQTRKPQRRYVSKRDAQKAGTEGRGDQLHAETTLLDGNEPIFDLIRREMTRLGWSEDRLRAFLRSRSGPNHGRDSIRTLADANRVHWALKHMRSAAERGAVA